MKKTNHYISKPFLILVPTISILIMIGITVGVFKHHEAIREYNKYAEVDRLFKKEPENIAKIEQDGDYLVVTTKTYGYFEGRGKTYRVEIKKLWNKQAVVDFSLTHKKKS
jgi:hypothetical protein